ncbi:hypothetical protein N431DRAFT_426337 [Stipitochalara longipes BDJ]|nr:hypothetical protein N431DRAFT_426337 [Stipitochalara longipes BDJ]
MAMRFVLATLALVLPAIAAPSQAQVPFFSPPEAAGSRGPSLESARANAPHIFNAIHSSMRQWGSSLNHNGMSFFPARIPNNTHLYHGTHTPDAVKGMEWLAFEIEHAEGFARSFPSRPRRPGKPEDPRPEPPGEPGEGPPPPVELSWTETMDYMRTMDDDDDMPDFSRGYLHIYRTTRPLNNLVYIDGMSAGKTDMGTLDSQDLVLRNNTNGDDGPAFGDFARGKELCDIGAEWGIEGFVRMEMGFEIIFCEFSDGLVLESAHERPSGKNESLEVLDNFEVLRGASLRYQGITGQRLRLDYSGMSSAYWYDLNLTNPDADQSDLPRLSTSDIEGLARMKADFLNLFAESSSRRDVGNDWQGITDMIALRYSDRLQFMAGNNTSKDGILFEIAVLLNIYVDYGNFDVPVAIEKCTAHYLVAAVPETTSDQMIHEALYTVMDKICSTLFSVGQVLREDEEDSAEVLEQSKLALKTLIDYLNWTTWKECGKCGYDEICFVAIWPWGSKEDHDHPSCLKGNILSQRFGYWGFPWGRKPPSDNKTRSGVDEL